MKKLLIALAALMIPVVVFAGNPTPTLYLEVYGFEEEPMPVPTYVCTHEGSPFAGLLPCFSVRMPYMTYYVPIHIGKLVDICTTTGPECATHGGFVGVPFGVTQTAPEGTPLTFMSWNACPGFLKGVSVAGEPAACSSNSTTGCKDWFSHTGYLSYLNLSTNMTRKVLLNIGPNADVGHNKVINCAFTYDEGTAVGGGAEIDDAQTIVCAGDPTAVEQTTWGKIKGLYR